MRIQNNIAAMNSHRQLGLGNTAGAKSMEKLSSGFRINRAGDDAAGLAISEKMRGQIRGLNQASRNSQDGISMIQTAEGALNETHAILQRMRELAVQSATDTNTGADRVNVQDEMNELTKEITRIADTTEFNTMKLLDGSKGSKVSTAVANVNSNTVLKADTAAAALTTATATLASLHKDAGSSATSLGIGSGDIITISYVKDGETITKTVNNANGTSAIADLAVSGYTVSVSNGTGAATGALLFTASASGTAGAINGLTITVKNSSGEVKQAATDALSSFAEITAAKDVRVDGSANLQIGANQGQNINLSIENMSAAALGVKNLKVGTQVEASVAINVIDDATVKVSAERSKLGAVQNRLEHTIKNLDTASENLQASESRIRDVDMAKEMMEFTKNNILQQAAQAMLAQANQAPQGVLQLLR